MLTDKFIDFSAVRLKDGREGAVVEVFDGGSAALVEIDGSHDLVTVKQNDIGAVIWKPQFNS